MKKQTSHHSEHKYALIVLTVELFVSISQALPMLQSMWK